MGISEDSTFEEARSAVLRYFDFSRAYRGARRRPRSPATRTSSAARIRARPNSGSR